MPCTGVPRALYKGLIYKKYNRIGYRNDSFELVLFIQKFGELKNNYWNSSRG